MNTLKCARFILLATRKRVLRRVVPAGILWIAAVLYLHSSFAFVETPVLAVLLFMPTFVAIFTFDACERVPQLYVVLPQRRVNFVRAVYFTYLLLTAGCLIVGLIVSLIFHTRGISYSWFLPIVGAMFFVFVTMTAILLPIAFKLGYSRIQYVFVVFVFIAGFAQARLMELLSRGVSPGSLLADISKLNSLILLLLFVVAGLVCLIVSYRISTRIYEHKDI